MSRTCSLDDCALPHYGRGWCNIHYKRWVRHGSFERRNPGRFALPISERFWSKVAKGNKDECWEWLGARVSKGYGNLGNAGAAHRVSYELNVGPIPEGLTIDHLCRNRGCVNPAHLEPVTGHVNMLRGISPWAINARKTSCSRGHPFDEENTIWIREGTARDCRACRYIRNHR